MVDNDPSLNPDFQKYYLHRTLNGVPIYRPLERLQEQLPKSKTRILKNRIGAGILYALPFLGLSAAVTYAGSFTQST